jgi:threonine/homoserine/homoserine lactone efflux protein
MISKVVTLYTATGAVLAVKEGLPVMAGIGIGLAISAFVVALGYLLHRLGLLVIE